MIINVDQVGHNMSCFELLLWGKFFHLALLKFSVTVIDFSCQWKLLLFILFYFLFTKLLFPTDSVIIFMVTRYLSCLFPSLSLSLSLSLSRSYMVCCRGRLSSTCTLLALFACTYTVYHLYMGLCVFVCLLNNSCKGI